MEKEIRTANVYNLIILDESGSMYSIYFQALSALNETLSGIRMDIRLHWCQPGCRKDCKGS